MTHTALELVLYVCLFSGTWPLTQKLLRTTSKGFSGSFLGVGCGLWLCTEWIAHGRQLITGRHVATTCNLDVVPRDFLAETFGYESNLVLSHFGQHRNGSGFWLVAGSLSTQQVCVRPRFQLTRAVEQDVFFWNNDTRQMHTNIIAKSR